ncbi:MAG TPA: putative ABC exporter domain-containing protein [Candidatus Baltobacteraceae bacterium]|jgi:hypothetical protein|nr:putative ABC exporter domain-containing protein [Candidatus Baltobacteraceae bacterium]
MKAIIGLEFAVFRNSLLILLRSPLRTLAWVIYLAILGTVVAARIFAGQHAHQNAFGPQRILPTAFAGMFFAVLGASIVYYASGHTTVFRSRAEAWLLNGCGLHSRTIALWLQARKLREVVTRWSWTVVVNFVVFLPRDAGAGVALRGFVVSIAATALLMALELPIFLLGKRGWGRPFIFIGILLTIIGGYEAVLGAASFLGIGDSHAWMRIFPFEIGGIASNILSGPFVFFAAFATMPLLAVFAVIPMSGDVIPELYAASIVRFQYLQARRVDNASAYLREDTTLQSKTLIFPSGPLTAIVWKEWLVFRRRPHAGLHWGFLCGLSVLMGGVAGILYHASHDPSSAWTLLGMLVPFVLFIPIIAAVSLGDDLAMPIWWMTTSSLFARLIAWSLARSWRPTFTIALAPMLVGLWTGEILTAGIAIIFLSGLWWSLYATGVFIASLFPGRLDARGPLMMLRLFAGLSLLLPGAFIFFLASYFKTGFLLAALLTEATFVLQGIGALAFAAERMRDTGIALIWSERST